MYKMLSAGAIGVRGTTAELAALAQRHGFGGLEFNSAEAADLMDRGELESLRAIYREGGLRVGAMGLPVQFRQDDAAFHRDLAALKRHAKAVGSGDSPVTPAMASMRRALSCASK